MIEKLVAAAVLVVCVALVIRLGLGRERKLQFDAFFKGMGAWPAYLPRKIKASRGAARAIRRAKEGSGEWKGNVYTPKSFRRPRKPH